MSLGIQQHRFFSLGFRVPILDGELYVKTPAGTLLLVIEMMSDV